MPRCGSFAPGSLRNCGLRQGRACDFPSLMVRTDQGGGFPKLPRERFVSPALAKFSFLRFLFVNVVFQSSASLLLLRLPCPPSLPHPVSPICLDHSFPCFSACPCIFCSFTLFKFLRQPLPPLLLFSQGKLYKLPWLCDITRPSTIVKCPLPCSSTTLGTCVSLTTQFCPPPYQAFLRQSSPQVSSQNVCVSQFGHISLSTIARV